ncbi:MAG: hypothetical protein Q9220_000998 [cf. Caloplaca sp. 1 TL-2023]
MSLPKADTNTVKEDRPEASSQECLVIPVPRPGNKRAAKVADIKEKRTLSPCVNQSFSLPSIEGLFPAFIPRRSKTDPAKLHENQLIPRLTSQISNLSLLGHFDTASTSWSRMERLPPEIINLIAVNLAFFDKKALASTSRRIYGMLEPVEPHDRFSWRLHLCSAFNRAPSQFLDFSMLEAEQVRLESERLVRLIEYTPTKGHYIFDPKKTRIKDITCLYFPRGFFSHYQGKHIFCQTLGQFIALQFHEYVARMIAGAKEAELQALGRRSFSKDVDVSEEQKEILECEARRWREVHDLWLGSQHVFQVSDILEDTAPDSAWGWSHVFLYRMGYIELQGRLCYQGKICESGQDFGMAIRKPSGVKERSQGQTPFPHESADEDEMTEQDDDDDDDDDNDEDDERDEDAGAFDDEVYHTIHPGNFNWVSLYGNLSFSSITNHTMRKA